MNSPVGQALLISVYCWLMSNVTQAQDYFEVSKITWHLTAVCAPFQTEVANEKNMCNLEVIDEVHDHAEAVQITGYNPDLVEDYLDIAQGGSLCYGEGLTIYKIQDACDCMNKVCDTYSPKNVDYCRSIVLSPFGNFTGLGHNPAYYCHGHHCLLRNDPNLFSASPTLPRLPWMILTLVAMVTMRLFK